MTVRHFVSMTSITPDEMRMLLDRAAALKDRRAPSQALAGKTVAMIFEKPSTRTRVSFQVAIAELGAHPLALSAAELQLGRGETVADTGRVLGRYVHGIVVRTFGQERVDELAATAGIPVVNALTDHEHPCQALADLLTIRERFGSLAGRSLAYVGDGNNVAHSLLLAGAMAGMRVTVATPPGYEPDESVVDRATEIASATGGAIETGNDPVPLVSGADAVYTDVWASMGQEEEQAERVRAFAGFQVDEAMMSGAKPEAIALHCLPAHRGEEISAGVLDGPQSEVWDQAENRLHVQKALLEWLLG
ncbi:MAG TPA: ornithine carbamoyltransferase [Actinomycetota bacterium]|nr:ornithine carbamoyltransferase [Actinomycetota bacterium]